MPVAPETLVLASASPRRRELLAGAGYVFEIVAPAADETPIVGEDATAYVARLARAKAEDVARRRPGVAVLAADTAVVLGGRIFGKPVDRDDALRMLRELAGREHQVITAACVLAPAGRFEAVAVTQVRFRAADEAALAAYVATGEPMDKAGAYAIQGRGGDLVAGIRGSRTNVIGLPMDEVRELLHRAGVRPAS